MAAPVGRGLAGDDGGDPLAAGGRPGQPRRAGCAAVAVGPAALEVHGRGADGDVDRGGRGGIGPGGRGRVSMAVTMRSSW